MATVQGGMANMAKYRKDFVTNSSSSSYVCDVCGESASGWDMGLEDAEMFECENGHTICEEETLADIDYKKYLQSAIDDKDLLSKLDDMNEGDLIDMSYDYEVRYCLPEEYCPICQFVSYCENDMYRYLKRLYKINPDDVFAKVKESNKRRRKLYDSEYIDYVCQLHDLSINSVIEEIKLKYNKYSDFIDFLRS